MVAGEPGTGAPAGPGNAATGAASAGKFGLYPASYQKGQVIYADSAAGLTTGPQVLYQAGGHAGTAPASHGVPGFGTGASNSSA